MPGVEESERTRGGRLVPVLLWSGVVLAPLGAVLLLLADGSLLLRGAVVLVAVSVVLVALSITLRRDGETMRLEAEDLVFDEIDSLRDDIRGDITHAVRATHKSLAEKIVTMNETVDALRGELNVLREGAARPGFPQRQHSEVAHPPHPPHPPQQAPVAPVGGGVLRHTETVHVTTRHTTVVDPNDSMPGQGTVYGGHASTDRPEYSRADGGSQYAGQSGQPGQYGARAKIPSPRRPEWSNQEPASESREATASPPPPRTPPAPQQQIGREAWDGQPSWTEQMLGQRLDEQRAAERLDAAGPPSRPSGYDKPGDGATGLQAGDRWAAVRSDDHGRELRMGERTAAVHTDRSGTEVRIEDRWAAVRREDSPRSQQYAERDPERRDGGGRRRAPEAARDAGSAWSAAASGGNSPSGNSWEGSPPSGGSDRAGHDRGGHDRGGHDRGGHDRGGHDRGGHDRGGHDRGGHDRGGHDRGGHDRGGQERGGPSSGQDWEMTRPAPRTWDSAQSSGQAWDGWESPQPTGSVWEEGGRTGYDRERERSTDRAWDRGRPAGQPWDVPSAGEQSALPSAEPRGYGPETSWSRREPEPRPGAGRPAEFDAPDDRWR